MIGWVRFHRRYLNSDLWLSETFTKGQAWVDLFSLANHKDKSIWIRGIEVKVKRGSLAWSEVRLAERWKWSRNKLRRFLNWLKTKQQIEQQKTNVTTLIHIINYERYQCGETPNDTPERHQKDSKRYTNNNVNNEDNEKKLKKSVKKKLFLPPSENEVRAYFIENGFSASLGSEAWKYYDAGNWKDSKGNQVLSWKQKMRGVWFKDKNRINGNNYSGRPDQNIKACLDFVNGDDDE